MAKVSIYSTPTCMYCKLAKDFFDAHNVKYEEFDVASDLVKREDMISRSGQRGVPVIEIDGKMIVGFDQNALSEALGI